MIVILNYEIEMQNEIKNFILKNMTNELLVQDKKTFVQITKDLEDINKNYIEAGGEMIYAYDIYQKKIVGTIAMNFENDIAILKRFYVDKEYRNRKIGFLLYQELEKRIIKKEIQEIYLTSGKELKNAHNFYERNGWILEHSNPGVKIREEAFLFKKIFYKKAQYCCI